MSGSSRRNRARRSKKTVEAPSSVLAWTSMYTVNKCQGGELLLMDGGRYWAWHNGLGGDARQSIALVMSAARCAMAVLRLKVSMARILWVVLG